MSLAPHLPQWSTEPASDQSASEQIVLAETLYEVFNDPELRALVEEALAHNADLRATAYRLEAAELLIRPARTAHLPQLGIAGEANLNGNEDQTDQSEQFGLNVSWSLDVWGRLAAQSRASRYELHALEADYEAAQLSLTALVAQNWVGLLEAIEATRLQNQKLATLEQLRELVRDRYLNGLTSFDDEAATRAQIELTRAELFSAQNRETTARRSLEVLLGRVPVAEFGPQRPSPDIQVSALDIPSRVLARRPDIQASFSRLSAAQALEQSAQAALLPDFTLTGGVTRLQGQSALIGDMTQWSLIGSASQTLFDYGARRSVTEARELESQAALEDYRQVVLTAVSEVETALTLEASLEHQLIALNAALDAARMTEADTLSRYRIGLVSAQDLISARLQTADIQLTQLRTQTAQQEARIQLGLALALPWPAKEGNSRD